MGQVASSMVWCLYRLVTSINIMQISEAASRRGVQSSRGEAVPCHHYDAVARALEAGVQLGVPCRFFGAQATSKSGAFATSAMHYYNESGTLSTLFLRNRVGNRDFCLVLFVLVGIG